MSEINFDQFQLEQLLLAEDHAHMVSDGRKWHSNEDPPHDVICAGDFLWLMVRLRQHGWIGPTEEYVREDLRRLGHSEPRQTYEKKERT